MSDEQAPPFFGSLHEAGEFCRELAELVDRLASRVNDLEDRLDRVGQPPAGDDEPEAR